MNKTATKWIVGLGIVVIARMCMGGSGENQAGEYSSAPSDEYESEVYAEREVRAPGRYRSTYGQSNEMARNFRNSQGSGSFTSPSYNRSYNPSTYGKN